MTAKLAEQLLDALKEDIQIRKTLEETVERLSRLVADLESAVCVRETTIKTLRLKIEEMERQLELKEAF